VPTEDLISLPMDEPIWERFFSVYPLVLVSTLDPDGNHDIAPKHLAMPMSWQNWFGFVCTPSHHTYQNIQRSGEFTVSFPRPDQVALSSLAASPRCDHDSKPIISALPVSPAQSVNGVLVDHCYLFLECELDRIVEPFGINSLIIGRICAAQIAEQALRELDRDDNDVIKEEPLLAYLYPFRFAVIDRSQGFPKPAGFKR